VSVSPAVIEPEREGRYKRADPVSPQIPPEPSMAAYQYIYVMKGLNKTFPGGKQVLKDIWLSFLPGAKIGVLGLNGAGKSTLLKLMAGQDDNFTGEAWAAEGAKVGMLEQEPKLDAKKDVTHFLINVRIDEGIIQDELAMRKSALRHVASGDYELSAAARTDHHVRARRPYREEPP
jgi:ATPase subunit of ABC transporter with duplicated ATPase domains